MSREKSFGERVNYIKTEGVFVASCVNMPILVQAKTLGEMNRKVRIIAKTWIDEMQKVINENNFEFKELNDEEWRNLK